MNKEIITYILNFLTLGNTSCVFYTNSEKVNPDIKVVIEQSHFWDDRVYGTEKSLPVEPLSLFRDIPILFGRPEITKLPSGQIILHADIVASTYFLLSRYEEYIRKDCRDIHGRFPGKESIIFKSGYAQRPLIDEYGKLLRGLLREAGVAIPPEKEGFSRIYLTHDVDVPFRFERFYVVCKQLVKNILHYNYCKSPLKKYFNEQYDDHYTFPKIIEYDNSLRKILPQVPVESIYFIITAGSFLNRKYYNFFSKKTNRLLKSLHSSGLILGLHVSYEGGAEPSLILKEAKRLRKFSQLKNDRTFYSRHHYLRWHEPEDIEFMEQAGITDDFTLAYADYAGFRCGTSHPYQFINPATQELSNVIIHPLTIMDCTLDSPAYMGLDYENAFEYCKGMIDQVYKHNGEVVLLWHNTEFIGCNYQEKLYTAVLEYIASKTIQEESI